MLPLTSTLSASETFQFTETVTGTTNQAVTWSVNGVNGGNSTVGTITPTGLYTAPATVPTSGTVITATSVADTTRTGTANVTLLAGVDPTLSSIDPNSTAQGSIVQDIYLSRHKLLHHQRGPSRRHAVPTTFISQTLLKAHVTTDQLTGVGAENVDVLRQNGDVSNPIIFTLLPVRPVVISAIPESAIQNGANFTATLDGGYFGTPTNPLVTASFNGQPRSLTITNTRQLNVNLEGTPDLSQAGLFPLVLKNNAVPAGSPSISAVNIAVAPPTSAISMTPTNLAVGSQPIAVAMNATTGTAVVVNRADNTISLVNVAAQTVTSLPVGNSPTGVAVDSDRNLAFVVNSGSNTLSVIDLSVPKVIATLPLPGGTTPFSIGVDSLTGRALVANASTNAATVLDIRTPAAPSVVTTVNIGTGSAPQVAIEPRLNWALVTPGGAGTLSIVNLGRPASAGDVGLVPFVVASISISSTLRGISDQYGNRTRLCSTIRAM